MERKFLVTVIGIIALVGGGAYVFLANSPAQVPGGVTPDPMAVEYRNTEYGFSFSLPKSWEGYSIVNTGWVSGIPDKETMEAEIVGGPIISIRHPLWTESVPRQDIPIMVFTLQQWNDMMSDKFHIGAAPINPSELGRNSNYVFALPARYNFAYPLGVEEVEQILSTKPLQVF